MSDERLKRPVGDARTNRAMEDRRVTENREISDSVRLQQLRQKLHENSILPNLPKIDGYHVFWATTKNERDSIPYRLGLGYEFVTEADVPGFQFSSVKSADYPGAITVNEMVALKISEEAYRDLMLLNHQIRPAEEEARLNSMHDVIREEAAKKGGRVFQVSDAEG